MIKNLLIEFGLSNTEAKILLNLIETGSSIASLISKRTKIKRPTVYAALDSLVNLGLVIKKKEDQVTYYSSVDSQLIPKILSNKAKIKLNEVIDRSSILEMHLANHAKMAVGENSDFKVEKISSVEAVYAELEKAIYSGSFDAIFNPQSIKTKYLERLVSDYLNYTSESEVKIREILVSGSRSNWYKSKITNSNHMVKLISGATGFDSDVILLDGCVLMTNYKRENEVGVKITDEFFYSTMKSMFDIFWNSLD